MEIKKITFIVQTLGMGGAENFLCDLATSFNKKNVQICVFTNYVPFKNHLHRNGIRSQIIPVVIDIVGNWKGLLKACVFLPKAICVYTKIVYSQRDTSAIVMSGFFEKIIVTPLARLFNIPVIWIEFAPNTVLLSKFLGLPGWLYSLVKRLPTTVIVPVKITKNALVSEVGIDAKQIAVIPCGRDIPQTYMSKGKKRIPFKNKFVICCVSRLEKGKGQDLLLQSFALILKKIPHAKLQIVGEGDFLSDLKVLASRLGIARSVTFYGRVSDSLKFIHSASVFVFPSVWPLEGFGLVTIEAMALQTPVVAFDCGPTREIITNGEDGYLVGKNNIVFLAKKIVSVYNNEDALENITLNGYKKYLKKYTMGTVSQLYLDEIKRVLND